jgi:hypothetical protein
LQARRSPLRARTARARVVDPLSWSALRLPFFIRKEITMSNPMKAFCLACALLVLTPALAVYSDLQATVSGSSDNTVTVSVHNPTSDPVSARVRVVVRVDDETYRLLTSTSFTVAAGSTASISLSAPEAIAEIIDDPEPIGT